MCIECIKKNNDTKRNRGDRRSHHDDDVVADSYIEIDNACWPLKLLLIIINLDPLKLMAAQHFQWLWLALHYCNNEKKIIIKLILFYGRTLFFRTFFWHSP